MSDNELVVVERAVSVAAVVAEMLQLPVEQADKPPAHDLILGDGDRGRAWGADSTTACHVRH